MAIIPLPHGLMARGLALVGITVGGVGMTVGWAEAREVAITAGEAAGGVVALAPEFFEAGMDVWREIRDGSAGGNEGTGPGGSDPDLFGTDEPGVPVPARHDH